MNKFLSALLAATVSICLIAASVAATIWFIQTIFN